MGIPYSREINSAFAQVTPLVAAGFQVLQTTKNISILLAAIQVLTALLLFLILLALLGVICTTNPDLQRETDELVTPVVRWLASWVFAYGKVVGWLLRVGIVGTMAGLGAFLWQGSLVGKSLPGTPVEGEAEGGDGKGDGGGS